MAEKLLDIAMWVGVLLIAWFIFTGFPDLFAWGACAMRSCS